MTETCSILLRSRYKSSASCSLYLYHCIVFAACSLIIKIVVFHPFLGLERPFVELGTGSCVALLLKLTL